MSNIIKLNQRNLQLLAKSVAVPEYNRRDLKVTMAHIGVGGFHRSHQAFYADRLMSEFGVNDCGICGIGLLDQDRKMYNSLKEQDYLYTLMVKGSSGDLSVRVIGSIVEFLMAPDDPQRVIEKLGSEEIKVLIYGLRDEDVYLYIFYLTLYYQLENYPNKCSMLYTPFCV